VKARTPVMLDEVESYSVAIYTDGMPRSSEIRDRIRRLLAVHVAHRRALKVADDLRHDAAVARSKGDEGQARMLERHAQHIEEAIS
jgi:hypothetical protein